jgi:hypothetical protein
MLLQTILQKNTNKFHFLIGLFIILKLMIFLTLLFLFLIFKFSSALGKNPKANENPELVSKIKNISGLVALWAAIEGTGAEKLYNTHMDKGLHEFREQNDEAYRYPMVWCPACIIS